MDIREEIETRLQESYRRFDRDMVMEDYSGERQILFNQVTIMKALKELLESRG